MKSKMLKYYNHYLFLILIITVSGCGVWQDFTVYFNRYYNATVLFEQIEEDIENQKRPLFDFKEAKLPSSTQTPIVKVIEKCSKILQFDKESGYVDKALFMIGKSFYYQEEYAKALRKFNELYALEETDMKLVSQYWIGLTELQLRNFDTGFEKLNEVKQLALAEEEYEILDMAYVKQIAFLNYRENYLTSVELSNELLKVTENDELKSEVYFQLGENYVELNDVENAASAYAEVENYSPSFEIEFLSKFESAKLQKELGNVETSLELFKDMRDEGKYSDNFDKLDLEIALIYLEKDEVEEALNLYTIIDTTYKNRPTSGEAIFKRAEIWEEYYKDYDSANVYYDRAIKSQAVVELKTDARRKTQTFKQYFKLKEEQEKLYTQIVYRTDPEAFYKDSLDYAFFMSQDSNKIETDSLGNIIDRYAMQDKEDDEDRDSNRDPSSKDSVEVQAKLTKPFKMTISDDSLNTLIAKNLYNLGNIFYGELEVSDSAYYYYSLVNQNYTNIPFRPKFLFTLGNYYSSAGDTKKSDSLFNYIYTNFSADPVAAEAAKKLGKTETGVIKNPAELSYVSAENIYYNSEFNTAIDSFYNIIDLYPKSPLAPKALYTIGFILENDLSLLDSAAAVYDSLSRGYGNTDYARAAYSKLNFYRSYHQKIQDSLDLIQKKIADSLAADSLAKIEAALPAPDSTTVSNEFPPDSLSGKLTLPSDSLEAKKNNLPGIPENKNNINVDSVKATKPTEKDSAKVRRR